MYGALARTDVPSRSVKQLKVPKAFRQMLLYLRRRAHGDVFTCAALNVT